MRRSLPLREKKRASSMARFSIVSLEALMADEDLFGEDYLFFYDDDASEASVTRDVDAILRRPSSGQLDP